MNHSDCALVIVIGLVSFTIECEHRRDEIAAEVILIDYAWNWRVQIIFPLNENAHFHFEPSQK